MNKNKASENSTAKYEQLWLQYFNDSLLEKGIISKDEHYKMNTRILNRTGRFSPSSRP